MEERNLTTSQLAERWQVTERTLQYWRSIGIGPCYLKLNTKISYRMCDVLEFEEKSLRTSTAYRLATSGEQQ